MAQENDVVLIYLEDRPLTFARIESIRPDAKPEWFQVKLLLLQVPLQTATWILRPAYIDGDPFTMGGKQMRMEKVVCPEEDESFGESSDRPEGKEEKRPEQKNGKVISLTDLKKK